MEKVEVRRVVLHPFDYHIYQSFPNALTIRGMRIPDTIPVTFQGWQDKGYASLIGPADKILIRLPINFAETMDLLQKAVLDVVGHCVGIEGRDIEGRRITRYYPLDT